MKHEHCKLCNFEDDVDYLHPIYDGRGERFILICEKCREKIFSDNEPFDKSEELKGSK